MKENMQKVEDAIIENLQIDLKKHLEKYLSDNNDAELRNFRNKRYLFLDSKKNWMNNFPKNTDNLSAIS